MPIQILPARLANQIAAGEVVERPASVIKELVENSLDAGATSIKVEVDKGGAKAIRVIDNGKGIAKDELALALSRHATSKIKDLNDLEAISSLGFRGEALASISSVARLTLTSKPAEQAAAWQASAEGRDMEVDIKPAAHPNGTTIAVKDLFFNTPARRKFLRTEKTEFAHIDEVIRRIALARFDVSFVLTHNGKVVRQFRAANNQSQKAKRVAQICGQKFIDHAVEVECQHDDLCLSGWIAKPEFFRSQNDLSYSYVNGRMMRDKLINHAIRQAYADYLPADTYPAFVLFLDLDHREVDVNVHPAKHEVRFHQGRYIHDFIFSVCHQAIINSFANQFACSPVEQDNELIAPSQIPAAPQLSPTDQNSQSTPCAQGNSQNVYQQNQQHIAEAMSGQQAQSQLAPYNTDFITPLQRVSEQTSSYGSTSCASSYSGGTYAKNSDSKGASTPQANQLTSSAVNAYQNLLTTLDTAPDLQGKNAPLVSPVAVSTQQSPVSLVTISHQQFAVITIDGQLRLLSLAKIAQQVNLGLVQAKMAEGIVSQPLLLPLKLTVTAEQLAHLEATLEHWSAIGIELQKQSHNAVQVRTFPAMLRHKDVSQSFYAMLAMVEERVAEELAEQLIAGSGQQQSVINIFQLALAKGMTVDSFTIEQATELLNQFHQQTDQQYISQLLLNSLELDLTSYIERLT